MFRFLTSLFICIFALNVAIFAQVSPCNQVITDPQGAGVTYLADLIFSDTLSGDANQSLTLDFSLIDLAEGDTLRVYDGIFLNELAVFTAGSPLDSIQSLSSSIILNFSSDQAFEAEGWEATVNCLPANFIQLTFPTDTICAGWEGTADFTLLSNLPPDLFIEALLSSDVGDFSNPTPIGEASTSDTTLFLALAADLTASDNYKIRIQINLSDSVFIYQDVPVHINTAPLQPSITGPTTFCGESITLSTEDQFRIDIQWFLNSDSIPSAINLNLNTNQAGTYWVTASNSCGTLSSSTFILTQIPLPTAAVLQTSDNQLCPGEEASISFTADGDTSDFTWIRSGLELSFTSEEIQTTIPGEYVLSRSNQCGSSLSDTLLIEAIPLPPAVLIQADGPLSFCESGIVQLNIPNADNNQIQWFRDSILIQTGAESFEASLSGTYSVSLSNLCGTTPSINTTEVSVQLNPVPALLSAAGPTTLCEGNSVLLLAEVASGQQVSWLFNGQPTGNSSLQLSADQTGVYSLTTSNSCGSVTSQNNIPVTINLLPFVPTLYSLSTPALCNGSSVTIAVEAQTGVTYAWKRNGSVYPGTTNSITASQQGVYTVSVSNGCGTLLSTNTISVISGSAPVNPTITAGGTTTFCQGLSVTLTTPPQQGVIYRWLLNGIPTGDASFSIQATQGGAYTVEVSNACDTLVSTTSLPVNVLPLPVQVEVSPIGEYSICQGDSFELNIPVVPGVSYQWRRNNQPVGLNTNSIDAFQEGSYTILLGNSCGTTPASNSVYLNIDSIQPALSAIVAQPGTALCPGGYVLLNAAPVPFQLYHWYLDGIQIPNQTSAVLQATEWGTYTLQTNNACGTSAESPSVTLGPGDPPSDFEIYITGDPVFCSNDSLAITAQAEFGVSIRWFLNDVFLVEGPAQIYVHQAGVYTANCWNGCGEASGTNQLDISTIPAPEIPIITLSGNSLTTDASGTLQWLDATYTAILGETSALFTPEPVNASYFVQTTAPNGCSAISEPFHYNVDGFEQINSTSLNFYPNPATELIFIQNSGISTSFQLCDITGRILKTSSITTNSIISVSLGDLTPGIYWLKTPSSTQRLVIF